MFRAEHLKNILPIQKNKTKKLTNRPQVSRNQTDHSRHRRTFGTLEISKYKRESNLSFYFC